MPVNVGRCFQFLACSLLAFSLFRFSASSETDSVPEPESPSAPSPALKAETVMIAVLVRNKQHTLPYFLGCLERLDYPKERISLWLRSDHNVDLSGEVLEKWLAAEGGAYHSVSFSLLKDGEGDAIEDGGEEEGVAEWSRSRYSRLIRLREEALDHARRIWAQHLWMLDSDVFITNNQTLNWLISVGETVVAPMLRSDGLYSNFWCGMTRDYYYQRTEDYTPILNRKTRGCHQVPMVHSSVLINLQTVVSDRLTYSPDKLEGYKGPHDDIITFALSANFSDIPMFVCNEEIFGYLMVPLEKDDQLSYDLLQLRNLKLEILADGPRLEPSPLLAEYVRHPSEAESRINVDRVYMISLLRRPERRLRMFDCFQELNITATTVDAVDGKLLTDYELERLGVKLMPGYQDPYHKRPMKRGEIGCFLSHYGIWQEVADSDYDVVMVLEDDVKFEPFFIQKLDALLEEVKSLDIEWDLIYLGRKRLEEEEDEKVVIGRNGARTRHLVVAGYSYWTLGYLLNPQGAAKLLAPQPLKNILPVDEYLPILYDKHPQDEWKAHFPVRNLIALSAEPLFLYPTRYLNEEGYISDTEDSLTVQMADAAAASTSTPSPEL